MPIFHEVMGGKISAFREDFLNVSRSVFVDAAGALTHAGEFGTYREDITRSFLRSFVPHRLDISDGFLVNAAGEVSTQADVIIYDGSASPMIETAQRQRFFPAEAVSGIGEVKSTLSGDDLRKALQKLAWQKVKAARRMSLPGGANPRYRSQDQVVSFLVCEAFRFETDPIAVVARAYEGLPLDGMHRHNVILSLKDGVMLYRDPANGSDVAFPTRNDSLNALRWYGWDAAAPSDHVARFCHALFEATCHVRTFGVDMRDYVTIRSGGFRDQA